jgi:hypothetical protein
VGSHRWQHRPHGQGPQLALQALHPRPATRLARPLEDEEAPLRPDQARSLTDHPCPGDPEPSPHFSRGISTCCASVATLTTAGTSIRRVSSVSDPAPLESRRGVLGPRRC